MQNAGPYSSNANPTLAQRTKSQDSDRAGEQEAKAGYMQRVSRDILGSLDAYLGQEALREETETAKWAIRRQTIMLLCIAALLSVLLFVDVFKRA